MHSSSFFSSVHPPSVINGTNSSSLAGFIQCRPSNHSLLLITDRTGIELIKDIAGEASGLAVKLSIPTKQERN